MNKWSLENEKMSGYKKKKKKKGIWIFLSIMFIVSVIAGNQAAALNHKIQGTLNLMNYDDSGVIAGVESELADAAENMEKSNDVINILLVGADKRSSWTEVGRSVSCMIATID